MNKGPKHFKIKTGISEADLQGNPLLT